jgi:aspartyl-tRNA(Asn)/glutamyl-tRNA(Gln) amidotransferase subunit A
MKLEEKTILETKNLLRSGELEVKEVTEYFLKKIDETNKSLNSFLYINEAGALSKSEEIDANRKGSLAGIPGAIKDNILIKGLKTTAGSKILEDYLASYNATTTKLLSSSGAIFLGKTNLDEFAMGSSTENSAFGVTKNPHDTTRVPGGSSGGSAAAVAAGQCLFSLGSDTGGSIRQPAAFCGVVGLKPTYGSVSRYGLISLASSLDVIGPFTKTIRDNAEVFYTISKKDKNDSTSFEDYNTVQAQEIFKRDPKKLRIGVPTEYFSDDLDPQIKKRIEETINKLSSSGFEIQKVSLPHTKYALATYYIIMPSEASANLARYDNLRYGSKKINSKTQDLIGQYIGDRTQLFGDEVRRRIILGVYSLSSGYYDDYYIKAQAMRNLIKDDFDKVFEKVDLLITPTTPTPAFKIGAKQSPLEMYLSDIFTVPASLAGLPAISLPCGKIGKLPIGLQIIGKSHKEEEIFLLGDHVESILRR